MKKILLGLIILCALAVALPASAVESILPACASSGICSLCDIVNTFLKIGTILMGIVGSLVMLMFVYGGFILLTSGGESGKIDTGKKILINSIIGLLITFLAYIIVAFVVNSLTEKDRFDWNITLKCAPMPGLPELVIAEDDSARQENQNKCLEDQTKNCGDPYTDGDGNQCIGKLCTVTGTVCTYDALTSLWDCGSCKPENAVCTDHRECCDGLCSGGKCIKNLQLKGGLGAPCDNNTDCQSPLFCQRNWLNHCSYGYLGTPCGGDDTDCAVGFHCQTDWGNNCVPDGKPFSPCNDDAECPTGYKCLGEYQQRYCENNEDACWATNHCTHATGSVNLSSGTSKTCVPENFEQMKVGGWCDCDSDADCVGVSYAGVSAPKCAFDDFSPIANRCQPGTIATKCNNNDDCQGGLKCLTNNLNMCGQGKIGEGAGSSDECISKSMWLYTCVPAGFVPPAPKPIQTR
ncbi:MAG: hypothetical protein NTZ49_01380 [Candidatus Parcubacteria bacterium]|nr:hypothetical protein [Candidatus Parcubacteria bacterium]